MRDIYIKLRHPGLSSGKGEAAEGRGGSARGRTCVSGAGASRQGRPRHPGGLRRLHVPLRGQGWQLLWLRPRCGHPHRSGLSEDGVSLNRET